jgi:hypothetical protein
LFDKSCYRQPQRYDPDKLYGQREHDIASLGAAYSLESASWSATGQPASACAFLTCCGTAGLGQSPQTALRRRTGSNSVRYGNADDSLRWRRKYATSASPTTRDAGRNVNPGCDSDVGHGNAHFQPDTECELGRWNCENEQFLGAALSRCTNSRLILRQKCPTL